MSALWNGPAEFSNRHVSGERQGASVFLVLRKPALPPIIVDELDRRCAAGGGGTEPAIGEELNAMADVIRVAQYHPLMACEACVFDRGEHAEWCDHRFGKMDDLDAWAQLDAWFLDGEYPFEVTVSSSEGNT